MSIIIAHQTKQIFFFLGKKMKSQVTHFGAVLLGIFYQIRIFNFFFFSKCQLVSHKYLLVLQGIFKLVACFKVFFFILRDETQEFKVV